MVTFRPYIPEDRAWVIATNLHFYRTAHDFDASFSDALVTALDHLDTERAETTSTYLIAEAQEGTVGCIFLSAESESIGRIRLFFLAEGFRGRGIGRQALQMALTEGRKSGLKLIRVSTFDCHPEACRLYSLLGFTQIAATPLSAFGRNMRQLDFELAY
ncbi:MAG: GNAT family N-acetyltransferase [Roseobacter sp.]